MQLAEAGCDIIRITTPGIREAQNLAAIKDELRKKGYKIPIVADIHFNPKPAEVAAGIVEKVRINPGNYVDRNKGKTNWTNREIVGSQERIAERIGPLVEICKKNNTAIRVGTNFGSLPERILNIYGNTPLGMVESAMEFVRIIRGFNFHNIVISMKASSYQDMVQSNLMLLEKMIGEGFYYPIHLGVTEAGNGDEARIKSAAGIGNLLVRGIGDTIRVSLSEDPINEIPFGKKLVEYYGRKERINEKIMKETSYLQIKSNKTLKNLTGFRNPVVSAKPDGEADMIAKGYTFRMNREEGNLIPFSEYDSTIKELPDPEKIIFKKNYKGLQKEELLIKSSVDFGLLFFETADGGIWLNAQATSVAVDLGLKILQALGLRYSKAEFISCPSCGRTHFDLFKSFEKVKAITAHLKGIKIAVMGCNVNGPGEMAGADYGYVGSGPGLVAIYKNNVPVIKNIVEEKAADALVDLIKSSGDWSQSK